MFLRLYPGVLALLSLVVCSTLGAQTVIHEKRDVENTNWFKTRRVPATAQLPVRIGLSQQNLHLGPELLAGVSHPDSPRFGSHYTAQEITDLFAPADATVRAALSWLNANGIATTRVKQSRNQGWLAFDASAAELEALLSAEYYRFEDAKTGNAIIACDSYHVAEDVQQHIDYITPGIKLMGPSSKPQRIGQRKVKRTAPQTLATSFHPKPNDTSTCDRAITPSCIRALYNIPMSSLNHSENALGIFETGDYYAQEDLDAFFSQYAPGVVNGTHPDLASIDGGKAPVSPKYADGESDLDLELAIPLIHPQKAVLYQTDDSVYTINGAGGLFNTFLDAIDGSYCSYTAFGETGNDPSQDDAYPDNQPGGYSGQLQCGGFNLTNVVSISYSKTESDLPYYYQQRQCNEFMKLALQGHSIIVASGDAGVAGRSWDPEPNGCLGTNNTIFNPGFPTNCPYVTVVGGTQIPPGKTIHDAETAAYDVSHDGTDAAYSSGGGFSNLYSVPDYQQTAIATYFSTHSPEYHSYSTLHNATHNDTKPIGDNDGLFNRIGRGMPDISAIGQNIVTYIDVTSHGGGYGLSEGTSASTPIVASMINLINEHRLAAGKRPIGFLNHILYSNPQIFNDITNGSNPGCGTQGFSAVPGWDPVTGLGTPKFPQLLETMMKLP